MIGLGSALAHQVIRWCAAILTGVGVAGGARLVGFGAGGIFVVGMVLVAAGAAVGMIARIRNMQNFSRWWRFGEPPQTLGPLTLRLFRVVTAGLFGVGLIIGSSTPASPLLLIPGVAGLVAVALTREWWAK